MTYDDQNYSDINPDTLQHQDWQEVALTIWAALRPCREATARGDTQPENKFIRWAKLKKWNPDCGFEVLVPGKLFGKSVFASVVLNIVEDDFDIFVQRSNHDLILVFSTRDEGPNLSPQARLQAAASKMLELTRKFDKWSRQQTLEENFPKEWIGTPATVLLRSLIAKRYVSTKWVGDSWSELARALTKQLLVRDHLNIEVRCQSIVQSLGWSRQLAVSFSVAKSLIFTACGFFLFVWLTFGASLAIWPWGNIENAWATSWHAILDLAELSQISGAASWVKRLLRLPIVLLTFVGLLSIAVAVLILVMRHAAAILKYMKSQGARFAVIAIYSVLALGVFSVSADTMQAIRFSWSTNLSADHGSYSEVDDKGLLLMAANEADSFPDRFDAQVWLSDMSARLASQVPDPEERLEILVIVHREATRANISPELVLAVVDVESAFNATKKSEDGALGLMQIDPYWLEELGRPGDELMDIGTNLRYGCMILKYYLDIEKGELMRALGRFDGTLGDRNYPNTVLDRLRIKWYRI